MPLHLKRPLAFLDLETTGTDVLHDRIVEIAIVTLTPEGTQRSFSKRIHPECAIGLESSLIHGIYDQDVADQPTFKQCAQEIAHVLEGCDLAGFGMWRLDIPMLVESFLRAGLPFDLEKRKIVDAQRLFHLMEKRNLTAAYAFYCQRELQGAHGAVADARATLEVLQAQVERYDQQTVYDTQGQPMGAVSGCIEALDRLTAMSWIDVGGRMVYDADGLPTFNFGKHKGKRVAEVLQEDPSYYHWIMRGHFLLDTKRKLTQIKLEHTHKAH